MSDNDDEDFRNVATDSSGDEEETIRWAYQHAKAALLSEEPNAVACFQRVLTMEDKKGSKTMWGFKALKHLVIASIQANDFDAAADQCGRLVEYSDVVSSAVMEPAIVNITERAQDPKVALMLCQATYNVRKPTTTWMGRCITLLNDVPHTQRPEILAETLDTATTLRNIISDAPHLDARTRHSHLLSIDAITTEIRFRRQEFGEVYSAYKQLKGQSPSDNPGAVATIYETFAKVLLSPSSNLKLDRPHHSDTLTLADYCLGKALKLYPTTDTQAHIRCWRYLTVIQALRGKPTSSKLAMPDTFKPEVDVVVRLAALYTNDHGDLFLATWKQGRDQLADPFLQEFFDTCAKAVRVFRNDLQEWRRLFEAGSYRECYLPLHRLAGDLRRRTSDNMIAMEKYEAACDTRTLILRAAEIEIFRAEGRQYTVWTSSMGRSEDAYRLAQTINSRAAAIVCRKFPKLAGQYQMHHGHPNFARHNLSRAYTLFADGDQDWRKEFAALLAFCNYLQVCRAKFRIEDAALAFLDPEECETLKELADALRKADAQGFAQRLQKSDLRLSKLMNDLLATDTPLLDDSTRQSRLLSIDAITTEIRFRRQEFGEVYSAYKQLKGQSPSDNPGAVATIYEIFAKVLLSHSSNLKLHRFHSNSLSLAGYCLEKALKLYPSTETQAHVRCWRYLTVTEALRGKSTSSKLAMPDTFKPEVGAVVRLAALYTNDHGDLFLPAWEQARAELADPFLQEFFDACAKAVRMFRNDLQEWRRLFEAGSYRECYLPLHRLAGDLRRRTSDNMITMEKCTAVRDTRTLIICAAEIETFHGEGRQYTNRASSMSRSEDAYRLAQTINSREAAFVCQLFGQDEMRSGRLNVARKQLSRAFVLYADGDQDRRRECAIFLVFCKYFQVCRVKYRLEEDALAFLGQEECEKLKELADALRKADAQGFAQLLQNGDLRLTKFMHDLLDTLSAELTSAMGTMEQAHELQASGNVDALRTSIKNLYADLL